MGDEAQPSQSDFSIMSSAIDRLGYAPAVPGERIAVNLNVHPPDAIANLANTALAATLRPSSLRPDKRLRSPRLRLALVHLTCRSGSPRPVEAVS